MKTFAPFVLLLLLARSVFSQQDPRQNLFRLAQSFEQQGEYERALQLYSDLFGTDSSNVIYFEALRKTHLQLKQYAEAIVLAKRRLKIVPYDFNLQANIGGMYVQAGMERQSDSVWNAILFASNKNQMYYRAVANEQTNVRQFDKAVGTYLRGRREIGDPSIFANELGYLYSFMMDFANSTREYLRMVRQNELQYDFVQSRIASLINRTDGLKAATSVVEEEIKLKQTVPLLRLQIWLYMEGDRYQDAYSAAQTLERTVNSQGQEIFTFAERVFKENEFSVAAAAYQAALKSGAAMAFAPLAKYGYARCIEELSLRGVTVNENEKRPSSLLETQPSFSGAVNLYSDLAKDFPRTAVGANALYRIGWIRYKQLFDLDGALRVFDSVLAVAPAGPMIPTVLSTTGDIFIAQNKLDVATLKFRAMFLSPYATAEQKTTGLFRQAEVQFFLNNFDSSLALLKPLTENLRTDESNDALILQYFIVENRLQYLEALKQFARAELLARQFKLGESVMEFFSVIDLYPEAPLADDALLKQAEYLIQLKRYPEALAAYRKLIDEYKESIEKDRAQFRIGEVYQFHMSDKPKAIAAYETILEKYPLSLFTEEARKRIRQLRGDSI